MKLGNVRGMYVKGIIERKIELNVDFEIFSMFIFSLLI